MAGQNLIDCEVVVLKTTDKAAFLKFLTVDGETVDPEFDEGEGDEDPSDVFWIPASAIDNFNEVEDSAGSVETLEVAIDESILLSKGLM